jgi:diguanylate cyclase (GGDEF)-like protein
VRETLEVANRELRASLAREQLRARTDDLTGLYNRRYFFELAAREFSVATRHGRALSFIMIDIDHFKRINDTFGHQTGDVVLAHVAQIAAAHRRSGDIVARYGGEEFVLLLPETTAEQALLVAEQICDAVAAAGLDTPGGRATFTISGGVAGLEAGSQSLEDLIRQADRALYAAKAQGRNRVNLQSSVQQVA